MDGEQLYDMESQFGRDEIEMASHVAERAGRRNDAIALLFESVAGFRQSVVASFPEKARENRVDVVPADVFRRRDLEFHIVAFRPFGFRSALPRKPYFSLETPWLQHWKR